MSVRTACDEGGAVWTMFGVCRPGACQPPPGMIWIPAGKVRLVPALIARTDNDFYVEGFYIDRYEVSNARYQAFIDAGGYRIEAYWNPVGWAWREANDVTLPAGWNRRADNGGGIAGKGRFPVHGVSWWEADAYCRWAGRRLPTELEWVKAAKGGCETHGDPGRCDASDTPRLPRGEELSGPQANLKGSGDPYEHVGGTTPVGFYDGKKHDGYQTTDSPSLYGLYDMVGNVWEWCSTMPKNDPYDPNDGRENPPTAPRDGVRILRGGSFDCDYDDHWTGGCARVYGNPGGRGADFGFRCVRSE
jgi:formylglycine-generating enzyme required for sulfatase activity